MGQSQKGQVLTRVSGLPPPPTEAICKGVAAPIGSYKGPGLDSRSPSKWVLRSSFQHGGSGV